MINEMKYPDAVFEVGNLRGEGRMGKRQAALALVLVSALWGSSFVGAKVCIAAGMFTFEILFFRFAIASLAIWMSFRKELKLFSRRAARIGILAGVATACNYALELFGLLTVSASKAGFLIATNSVIFSLMHCAVRRTKPKISSLAAVVLSMVGVGVLGFTDGHLSELSIGDVLLLLSAGVCAFRNLLISEIGETESRIQVTFLQLFSAAIVLGIITVFRGFSGAYTVESVTAVIFLAIFPTYVCHMLKNVAMKYLDPILCMLILATESIFCAVFSILLLGDILSWQLLAGSVLIITAIVLEILDSAKRLNSEKREIA